MILNELSRLSQLSDKQAALLNEVMAAHGVTISAMADEIYTAVSAIPELTAYETSQWYFDAHDFTVSVADEYSVNMFKVAGVIAAVSPRMPWVRNKAVAEAIVRDYNQYDDLTPEQAAKAMGMGLGSNIAMAIKILRAENVAEIDALLTGTKRRSFFNNISFPATSDSVTVDTWAMMAYVNVAGTDKSDALAFLTASKHVFNGSGVGYVAIAEAYRQAAQRLDMIPSAVQAVYWCAVAGSSDGSRPEIKLAVA